VIAPGTNPVGLVRVANAVKVHLITMSATWPLCCQHAQLNGAFSIHTMIGSADHVNVTDWNQFFTQIGGVQPGQGQFAHTSGIGDVHDDPHYVLSGQSDSGDSDLSDEEPSQDENPVIQQGTKRKAGGDDNPGAPKKPRDT